MKTDGRGEPTNIWAPKNNKGLNCARLLGAVLHGVPFHVYVLRDDNGGTIVWNADGYLFMTIVRRGYRMISVMA